jgi:pimeloyl-ACP methyl ester carboxylesterase
MTVQPFRIDVAQAILDDLHERLVRTRWPDEVDSAGWDYGTNLGYLKELVSYWQHTFDWRAQEAQLNQFAQFCVEIDGFGIHFLHERGKGPNPLPILLLHGWPDSFYRFYKLIPMLADPASHGGDPADAFDVIVPSLAGFGFSDRPQQRGGGRDAELFPQLMIDVLGYQRFGVHGGDTGSPIAQFMAGAHPEAIVGIHVTDIGWNNPLSADAPNLSEAEKQYLDDHQTWWQSEGAYAMIQGTKPQTLAYGLNDSPVGLAAWITEKFRTWSDCNGDVERRFSKDELLTNIMIYWATQTINSSIRGYYEGMHAQWDESAQSEQRKQGSDVPVGLALFPKDHPPPRETAERSLNVQHWTEMPRGGHFAALEEPELLAEDLRAFFRPLRAAS